MRHLSPDSLLNRGCVAQTESWRNGRIVAADGEWLTVHFFDNEEEKRVQVNRVIPNLSLGQIEAVLRAERISFDLHGSIKKHSLASETGAAASQALGVAGELCNQSDALLTEVDGFLAEVRAA